MRNNTYRAFGPQQDSDIPCMLAIHRHTPGSLETISANFALSYSICCCRMRGRAIDISKFAWSRLITASTLNIPLLHVKARLKKTKQKLTANSDTGWSKGQTWSRNRSTLKQTDFDETSQVSQIRHLASDCLHQWFPTGVPRHPGAPFTIPRGAAS